MSISVADRVSIQCQHCSPGYLPWEQAARTQWNYSLSSLGVSRLTHSTFCHPTLQPQHSKGAPHCTIHWMALRSASSPSSPTLNSGECEIHFYWMLTFPCPVSVPFLWLLPPTSDSAIFFPWSLKSGLRLWFLLGLQALFNPFTNQCHTNSSRKLACSSHLCSEFSLLQVYPCISKTCQASAS